MALQVPQHWNSWAVHHSGQRRAVRFTLKSSSEVLETWERGITVLFQGSAHMLYVSGDSMVWLNDRSRKIEVQMMIIDSTYSQHVADFDRVTIAKGECYVFQSPSVLNDITGQSRGRRNTGNQK